LFAVLTLLLVPIHAVPAKDFDDAASGHIAHPEWFATSPFNDLEGLLDEALSEHKTGLMVLFTTQGCSYCDQFIRVSLGDPQIAERLRRNFSAIGFEIFDDREMTDPLGESLPIKTFAKREGAGYSPTLLFYGEGGKLLVRQVGYQSPQRFARILDYLTEEHAKRISLRDYLREAAGKDSKAEANPILNRDLLFMQPPYALDRSRFPAAQPLLVVFEKPACPTCDDFHREVLALNEVRELLEGFDIARLDAQDARTPVITPGGQRTTPALWWAATRFSRLPALMFFEENGRQVLETDALVKRQRMLNSVNFVLQRAYEKDWTYQRFARTTAIEKLNRQRK
jgi:thioredoxin-related protein